MTNEESNESLACLEHKHTYELSIYNSNCDKKCDKNQNVIIRYLETKPETEWMRPLTTQLVPISR